MGSGAPGHGCTVIAPPFAGGSGGILSLIANVKSFSQILIRSGEVDLRNSTPRTAVHVPGTYLSGGDCFLVGGMSTGTCLPLSPTTFAGGALFMPFGISSSNFFTVVSEPRCLGMKLTFF